MVRGLFNSFTTASRLARSLAQNTELGKQIGALDKPRTRSWASACRRRGFARQLKSLSARLSKAELALEKLSKKHQKMRWLYKPK